MKLPAAQLAIVEHEKVIKYLLDPTHPENGGKAAFFHRLGFDRTNWQLCAAALRGLAATGEVTRTMESRHGSKYIVDGQIKAPNGNSYMVRSVWITEHAVKEPRLVTAYPQPERG